MILKKTIYNDDKNYAPREGEQIFGPNENRSTAESPIVQAQMAREDAAKASKRASEAVKAAGEAAEIANAVSQKVWSDDSGLHISDGNQDAAATRNTIWNSLGMLFRKGLNPILGILTGDNPRVAIYDGQGSGEEHEVASFGASARIGKNDAPNAYRTEIGLNGLVLIQRSQDNTHDIQYARFGEKAFIGLFDSYPIVSKYSLSVGEFDGVNTERFVTIGSNGRVGAISLYGLDTSGTILASQIDGVYVPSDIRCTKAIYVGNDAESFNAVHIGEIFNWQGNLKSNLTANADAYVEGNGSITLKGGHVYLILAYVAMTNSTNGTVNRRAQIFNKTADAAILTGDKFVASQVWGTVETQTIYEAGADVTLTVRGSASRPTTTVPTAWIRAVCIA